MLEIISVVDKKKSTNNIKYIANSDELNSMAKKYNYAIEKYCLPSNEQYFCFRHDDLTIRTASDIVDYKLSNLFKTTNVGVAGVIGTFLLENSAVWWLPNRPINAAGNIVQGFPDGHENTMADWPGTHVGLATVDGCCLFISRKLLEAGIRFDENLPGYHFYDADICCQALANGFDVATVDILTKHESTGEMPPEFEQYRQQFLAKWTPKIDHWPIGKYTIFK